MTPSSLLLELEQLERDLTGDIALAQHRNEHVRLTARANVVSRLTAHLRSEASAPPVQPESASSAV